MDGAARRGGTGLRLSGAAVHGDCDRGALCALRRLPGGAEPGAGAAALRADRRRAGAARAGAAGVQLRADRERAPEPDGAVVAVRQDWLWPGRRDQRRPLGSRWTVEYLPQLDGADEASLRLAGLPDVGAGPGALLDAAGGPLGLAVSRGVAGAGRGAHRVVGGWGNVRATLL